MVRLEDIDRFCPLDISICTWAFATLKHREAEWLRAVVRARCEFADFSPQSHGSQRNQELVLCVGSRCFSQWWLGGGFRDFGFQPLLGKIDPTDTDCFSRELKPPASWGPGVVHFVLDVLLCSRLATPSKCVIQMSVLFCEGVGCPSEGEQARSGSSYIQASFPCASCKNGSITKTSRLLRLGE